MDTVRPQVLIVSNKHDYSTDHVAFTLNQLGVPYLRLNRDEFPKFKMALDPNGAMLVGETQDFAFEIASNTLASIYFRAPIYLRDIYQPKMTPDEQFSRSQWAAFVRSLAIYRDILWVNDPQATFLAEVKAYQLFVASRLGFKTPRTTMTNSSAMLRNSPLAGEELFAMKTIDPMVLNEGDEEGFVYTSFVSAQEIQNANLSAGPVTIQEALTPKVDVRVTVIGGNVFAVSITKGGESPLGDWRLEKDSVEYSVIELPQEIENLCRLIVKQLGLNYGAIDLAIYRNQFYFLEINPTGEWAWLLEPTGLPLDKELAALLSSPLAR